MKFDLFLHYGEPDRLTEIGHKLDRLLAMAKTQEEFDVEMTDFIKDVTQAFADGQAAIDAAVQSIIDAINAGKPPADLQTEFDTLEAARADFKAKLAAIPGQLPTTPTPPSGGAPTPA